MSKYLELSERFAGRAWQSPEEFTAETGCHLLPAYDRAPQSWSIDPLHPPAGAVIPTPVPTAIGPVHSDPYVPSAQDAIPNMAVLATVRPWDRPKLPPLANFLGVVNGIQPYRCTLQEARDLIARVNAAVPGCFPQLEPVEWNLSGSFAFDYSNTPYRAYRVRASDGVLVDLAALLQHEKRAGEAILRAVWTPAGILEEAIPPGRWIEHPSAPGKVEFQVDPRIGAVLEFADPVARPRPVVLQPDESLMADRVGGPQAELRTWVLVGEGPVAVPGQPDPAPGNLSAIAQGMTEIYTLVADLHRKVDEQAAELAALRAQVGRL